MPKGMGKYSYGKPWGPLTAQPGIEYQQVSSGESHSSGTRSDMLDKSAEYEYQQVSSGEGHPGSPSGKFLGPTKGNKDLPPNHTTGVSSSGGGKRHVAGGKNAGSKADY